MMSDNTLLSAATTGDSERWRILPFDLEANRYAAAVALNRESLLREVDAAVRGARRHADGLCAGMNRIGVAQTHARPAPVLPAVLKRVVVNRLAALSAALRRGKQQRDSYTH